MNFIHLPDLPSQEIVPGYHARFVHTGNVTVAFWEIEAGAALPQHQHPHEQATSVLEGEFELTIAGETRRCKPGDVAVIPGGAAHSGKAISDCKLMDVFYPERQEYK